MPTKWIGHKVLYHVTSKRCANAIAKSGKMLRGSSACLFDSGIYFCDNVADCKKTALHGDDNPYVVKCEVFMGRAVLVDCTTKIGKQRVTHTALRKHKKRKKGCNSILAYNIRTGKEYVVYNHAYCHIISIKSEDGSDVVYENSVLAWHVYLQNIVGRRDLGKFPLDNLSEKEMEMDGVMDFDEFLASRTKCDDHPT
jgi:hypothetical protein